MCLCEMFYDQNIRGVTEDQPVPFEMKLCRTGASCWLGSAPGCLHRSSDL